jgi:hypothetical protein
MRNGLIPVVLVGSIAAASARAQDLPAPAAAPSVTVRGDGVAAAKPDFARLEAVVTSAGSDLKTATDRQRARAAQAAAVLDGLKARGLTVERSDFVLDRDAENGAKDNGYTAETDFRIRLNDLGSFDSVMEAVADSGVMQLRKANFEARNPAVSINEARQSAMRAARTAAEAYAAAGGFKLLALDKVLDVTPQTFSTTASLLRAGGAASTLALEPPTSLPFRASVIVTWRIGPGGSP